MTRKKRQTHDRGPVTGTDLHSARHTGSMADSLAGGPERAGAPYGFYSGLAAIPCYADK